MRPDPYLLRGNTGVTYGSGFGPLSARMPGSSETLPALEDQLVQRLLAFERLDEAWPRGRTAIERAEIGRQREDALSEIASLRTRIATGRADRVTGERCWNHLDGPKVDIRGLGSTVVVPPASTRARRTPSPRDPGTTWCVCRPSAPHPARQPCGLGGLTTTFSEQFSGGSGGPATSAIFRSPMDGSCAYGKLNWIL